MVRLGMNELLGNQASQLVRPGSLKMVDPAPTWSYRELWEVKQSLWLIKERQWSAESWVARASR